MFECGDALRFRGGSRSTSGRTRSIGRSRYSRTTDYRSRYGRSISSARSQISRIGWKKALLAGGLLYLGSRFYLSRRMYYDHPYRKPTICSNYIDSDENGTIYQMFICPRHYEMDSFAYCCGPSERQTCCKSPNRSGSVIGAIIGAILLVAIIGAIIYCVCRHNKKRRGEVLSKNNEPTGTVLVPPPQQMPPPGMGPVPPQPMGYGTQPSPMMGYGPDPNQAGYPQQPLPGQNYPPAYGQLDLSQPPYPSAPSYPGQVPPPPPGFTMSGPVPSQPPPPYPAS